MLEMFVLFMFYSIIVASLSEPHIDICALIELLSHYNQLRLAPLSLESTSYFHCWNFEVMIDIQIIAHKIIVASLIFIAADHYWKTVVKIF